MTHTQLHSGQRRHFPFPAPDHMSSPSAQELTPMHGVHLHVLRDRLMQRHFPQPHLSHELATLRAWGEARNTQWNTGRARPEKVLHLSQGPELATRLGAAFAMNRPRVSNAVRISQARQQREVLEALRDDLMHLCAYWGGSDMYPTVSIKNVDGGEVSYPTLLDDGQQGWSDCCMFSLLGRSRYSSSNHVAIRDHMWRGTLLAAGAVPSSGPHDTFAEAQSSD